jgi:WD40 repeat protein/serine/threonine protein kinase
MSNPAAGNPAADRNLLFGILAVQMDFVRRDALISAMNTWVLAKHRPLGELLQEQGALSAEHRQLLEQMAAAHLKAHGGDAQQSLAAVRHGSMIGAVLGSVADRDLQASLAVADGTLRTTDDYRPPSEGTRYRVLRPHARGGLGVVSVARDTELGREVALKEIQAGHAGDTHSQDRFVREAEITGGLEHPGVVPVYGLGRYDDGRPYYAMRFIRGESLQEAIKKLHTHQAGYSLRGLLTRFVAVCNAVAYAHSRGVIHRDLKPANVMLGPYGETLVVDWGLAKVIGREPADGADSALAELTLRPPSGDSSMTQAGSALGTPAFMSPEQARGEVTNLGPATDIYSLGATLYVLLTGRPPIHGRATADLLENVRLGNWRPARQLQPNAPKPLDAIACKALALKSGDRYATALELAADVERWLADEPVQAYPEPWTTKAGRWVKRHRQLVTAAVVLLLAAVPLLLIIAVNSTAARQRAEDDAQLIREQKEIADSAKETADQSRDEAEKRRDQLAAANDTLRRTNYVADMNLARVAWDENNFVLSRTLLERYLPRNEETDLRGFEWQYLRRLTRGNLWSVKAHNGVVSRVVYTPDGKRLFSCGPTRAPNAMSVTELPTCEIKLWDVATGRQLPLELKGPNDQARRISLSPDGTQLGAACGRHGIRIWDIATGQSIVLADDNREFTREVRFSPDGKQLVVLSSPHELVSEDDEGISTVKIWDLASRKALMTLDKLPALIHAPAFSPDGKRLTFPHFVEYAVRVVNTNTGQQVLNCNYGGEFVCYATFSPDGKSLAICGNKNPTIWDASTGEKKATYQTAAHLGTYLAYSPDGRYLAMTSLEGLIELWDTGTGQKVNTFKGHAGEVNSIAFSPDGTRLASAGSDGTLRVWDATGRIAGKPIFKNESSTDYVDLSPDGHTILRVSVDGQSMHLLDASTGTLRGSAIQSSQVGSLVGLCWDWTADGKHLVNAGTGKSVTIYDAGTGAVVHKFEVDRESMRVPAFCPNGRWLAYSGRSGSITILDAVTGAPLRTIDGLTAAVHNLTYSADGSHLCAADSNGVIKIWEVTTGRETMSAQMSDVYMIRIRFSPDGTLLAIVGNHMPLRNGVARLLDTRTGRKVMDLGGHSLMVFDAAFSRDCQRLATCSADTTVRLWDIAAGQEILLLKGHPQPVQSVRFLAGGHRLMSVSTDGTVRVWDATPMGE